MAPTSSAQSLRPKDAAELLGIGLATFWRWAKERPNFPRPRKLSARCTVFDRDELLAWRDSIPQKPASGRDADPIQTNF